MAFFEWREEYAVNIRELDAQHHKLVSLLNQLFEAMQAGSAEAVVRQILADLVDYVHVHFEAEERLMKRTGYPEYDEHRRKHEAMKARVLEYHADLPEESVQGVLELSRFLKGWLQKHICETDQSYGPFLNSRGIL